MNDPLDSLVSDWTRIGAGFGAVPAAATPDLEALLLGTARHAGEMPRLFIMAATWLRSYGDLVAKHRLNRLIQEDLDPGHRPVLGLLLDIAQEGTHPPEFGVIIKGLEPASPARPLYDVMAADPNLVSM